MCKVRKKKLFNEILIQFFISFFNFFTCLGKASLRWQKKRKKNGGKYRIVLFSWKIKDRYDSRYFNPPHTRFSLFFNVLFRSIRAVYKARVNGLFACMLILPTPFSFIDPAMEFLLWLAAFRVTCRYARSSHL